MFRLVLTVCLSIFITNTALAQVPKEELKRREQATRDAAKAKKDAEEAAEEQAKAERKAANEKRREEERAARDAQRAAQIAAEEAKKQEIRKSVGKGVTCTIETETSKAAMTTGFDTLAKAYSKIQVQFSANADGSLTAQYREDFAKLKVRHQMQKGENLADYVNDPANRDNVETSTVEFPITNLALTVKYFLDLPYIGFKNDDFEITWAPQGYTDFNRSTDGRFVPGNFAWINTDLNREKVNGVKRRGAKIEDHPWRELSLGFGTAGWYFIFRYLIIGSDTVGQKGRCQYND